MRASRLKKRATDVLRQRELAGDRRVGRWARNQALERQARFAREFWWALGLLIRLPLCAAPALLLAPRWSRLFAAGVLFASGIWLAVVALVILSGSSTTVMGRQGEVWTAQELRRQRRRGWKVLHGLKLRGDADIDHVVLGPPGVLVIESKWAADPWPLDQRDDWRRKKAVEQAERNTRQVASQFRNVHADVAVTAVVVLWHPPADDNEERVHSFREGSVVLVDGAAFRAWLDGLDAVDYDHDAALRGWADLDRHVRRRDERDIERFGSPPRAFGQVMWGWLQWLAGSLGAIYASVGLGHLRPLPILLISLIATTLTALWARRFPPLRPAASGWATTGAVVVTIALIIVLVHTVAN